MADERADLADELRQRARDLYRRSDNLPLGDRASIGRVGDLRAEADDLIRRADRLDPPAKET